MKGGSYRSPALKPRPVRESEASAAALGVRLQLVHQRVATLDRRYNGRLLIRAISDDFNV